MGVIFKYGILFIGIGVDKGKCLFDFFGQNNWKKRKIIFVDDMEKNIKSVLKACYENKIPCLPVWFQGDGPLTEKEKKIGDFQLHYLLKSGKTLSNDEAEVLCNNFYKNGGDLELKIV
jgi:hypothetical protein